MSCIFYILHICVIKIHDNNNIKNICSRKKQKHILTRIDLTNKLIWEKRKIKELIEQY